jgi:hypothetical protein
VIIYELDKLNETQNETIFNSVQLRINNYIPLFGRQIEDLERELTKLTKLTELRDIHNDDKPNKIRERINKLKKAKDGYNQQLKTISDSKKFPSPSPPPPPPVGEGKQPFQRKSILQGKPVEINPVNDGNFTSLSAVAGTDADEGADNQSTSISSKLKQKARTYDTKSRLLHIPAINNDNDDDNEIILVEIPDDFTQSAGGDNDGKYIQTGGAPESLPPGSVIYKFDPKNPKLIPLLASFSAPNQVLHDSVLITALKEGITPTPVDDFDYEKIKKAGLITSEDTDFLSIGRRAVYKSSILKLMTLLDSEIPVGETRKTYTQMYLDLWMFMNSAGCVRIIKALLDKSKKEPETELSPKQVESSVRLRRDIEKKFVTDELISQISDWVRGSPNNKLLDVYFKVFTRCAPPSPESQFLEKVTAKKNKSGIDGNGNKDYRYRFKLNWIILIAFHCHNTNNTTYPLERVGELVFNTYKIFLGWMTHDTDTYNRIFLKTEPMVDTDRKDTYKNRIKDNINSDLTSDITLNPLKLAIIAKLCGETLAMVQAEPVGDDEAGADSAQLPKPKVLLAPPSTPISSDTERLKQISEIERGQGQGQGQGPTRPTGVTMLNFSKLPSSSPPQTVSSARFTRRIKSDNTKQQPQTYREYTSPYRQTSESLRTRKIRENQVVPEPQPEQQPQPFRRRPLPSNRVSPEHGQANTTVKDNSSLPEYNTGSYNVLLPNERPTLNPRPPLRTSKGGKGRTRKHRRDKHRHKYTRKFTRIV